VASSLRSLRPEDRDEVLRLSRRALNRPAEQVGNPLWATRDELESELSDWDFSPEETLFVHELDASVVGFGGIEVERGWEDADLFGPLVAPGYRGRGLGPELLDASLEVARRLEARRLVASVGVRNLAGRLLLENAGFHVLGSAKSVFRLAPGDHRRAEEGPEGVEVRQGTADDLEAAIRLYHECFPNGVFPDESWREALARGTVWLAESDGQLLAFLDIDPSDRWAYHIGVVESERARGLGRFLLSRALDDYWAGHAGETIGVSVEADNIPSLRLLRRQGFAPWLVLQSYELRL
jgi:ribosomal protein S18 acetylase RimI-like enzyme